MADYGFQAFNANGVDITKESSSLFPCDVINVLDLGPGTHSRSYALGDREYLVVKQAIASKSTSSPQSTLNVAVGISISGGNVSFNVQGSFFPGFGGSNTDSVGTLFIYKKGNV